MGTVSKPGARPLRAFLQIVSISMRVGKSSKKAVEVGQQGRQPDDVGSVGGVHRKEAIDTFIGSNITLMISQCSVKLSVIMANMLNNLEAK